MPLYSAARGTHTVGSDAEMVGGAYKKMCPSKNGCFEAEEVCPIKSTVCLSASRRLQVRSRSAGFLEVLFVARVRAWEDLRRTAAPDRCDLKIEKKEDGNSAVITANLAPQRPRHV
jgi:hypothetical protein